MKTEKLVAELRRMKVETGSIVCLGCGREYACGIHGCTVMRDAADRLEELVDRCARYAEEIAVLLQHEGMNGMTVTHWMEISEEQA